MEPRVESTVAGKQQIHYRTKTPAAWNTLLLDSLVRKREALEVSYISQMVGGSLANID